MSISFMAKPYLNKRTKQISVTLPKKKLNLLKKESPKRMKMTLSKIEW